MLDIESCSHVLFVSYLTSLCFMLYDAKFSFFFLLLFCISLSLPLLADSTVLAYVLSELNRRHNYGLDLFLLSVDEGITGYRDDSLETVKRNEIQVSKYFLVIFHFIFIHIVLLLRLQHHFPDQMFFCSFKFGFLSFCWCFE